MRSPRPWLYAAGLWLVLAGLVHLTGHVWTLVLQNGVVGQRALTIDVMDQTRSLAPLRPSMWTSYRAFSASLGLLFIFAGAADIVLARTRAADRTLASMAMLGACFWTAAFIPFALDPVILPMVTAVVAVPMHGIAFLTASEAARLEAPKP